MPFRRARARSRRGARRSRPPEFGQFAAQGAVAIGRMGSFDNPESRGVGERCLIGFGRNAGPPMFPNGWYKNNYLFTQGKDEIAIVVEMNHDVRHVRLVEQTWPAPTAPTTSGLVRRDSVGRWEGDTLVVETPMTSASPRAQAYYGAWKDLKVTERFTRVGKDRARLPLHRRGPSVWDRPWGGEYEVPPAEGPGV